MFVEPVYSDSKNGWIEVVCGCMFSGKTEELIRRINRARIAHLQIQVFKPKTDNRYHDQHVVSHNSTLLEAMSVAHSSEILANCNNVKVVGIDEAQFFDEGIVEVCNTLANNGIRVIVAGLDMDYRGKPFGPMPNLLAIAEFVTKLHAICAVSGDLASYSYRKSLDDKDVFLGGEKEYEARSRKNFYI